VSEPIQVVHYQRKPIPGWYSIERIFDDVRRELPADIEVKVEICRYQSHGLWRRIYNILEAAFRQRQVGHVTGDVHFLTYAMRRSRTVLTITDCVLLEKKGLGRWAIWFLWYWLPMRRCSVITVISAATKRQLLSHVRCDPERIQVVHCSVADRFQADPRPFRAGRPRILQVGTTANKNIERVAEALRGLSCQLVVIGRLSESQRHALKTNGVDYETRQDIDDDALVAQYREADILIFASVYEGFGLPIVEANAIGRPVVTSNLSSMPEIAGDAACLVDPYDVASIRSGVERVIAHEAYRNHLVSAGHRNVERFRPAAISKRYADIYRRIARGAESLA
jgi:glycosyltransferase involved in cell wall biosynthesis